MTGRTLEQLDSFLKEQKVDYSKVDSMQTECNFGHYFGQSFGRVDISKSNGTIFD